jgi:hypothetical protein
VEQAPIVLTALALRALKAGAGDVALAALMGAICELKKK